MYISVTVPELAKETNFHQQPLGYTSLDCGGKPTRTRGGQACWSARTRTQNLLARQQRQPLCHHTTQYIQTHLFDPTLLKSAHKEENGHLTALLNRQGEDC